MYPPTNPRFHPAAFTRGIPIVIAALAVTILGIPATLAQSSQPTAKPLAGSRYNIVVVLADDLRYDTLSCAGHPLVKTPAIDRLAHEGVTFANSFVITPLCAPSRATMFTGRPTYAHGVSRSTSVMDKDTPTFADILQTAGYETAIFGKYGLARHSRPKEGFDHWGVYAKPSEGGAGDEYYNATFNIDGKLEHQPGFSTDALTEYAVQWIRARGDKPYFLLLSLKNPHTPHSPPKRHAALYRGDPIEFPESMHDPLDQLPRVVQERGEGPAPRVIGKAAARYFDQYVHKPEIFVRRYLRLVPSIDDAVRELYAALKQTGQLDRTVFIFTSDNGFLLGEHGLIGKELAYEESIRVPLIVRTPAGRVFTDEHQVLNLDWPATFLDIAGAKPAANITGRSLVPLIEDKPTTWRDAWLMTSEVSSDGKRPQFMAVRTDEWKYVRYVEGNLEEQLFNLKTNPTERQNLAADPAQADKLSELRHRMQELMTADKMPANWFEPK